MSQTQNTSGEELRGKYEKILPYPDSAEYQEKRPAASSSRAGLDSSRHLFEDLFHIVGSRNLVLFAPDVFDIRLPQPSEVNGKI